MEDNFKPIEKCIVQFSRFVNVFVKNYQKALPEAVHSHKSTIKQSL